MPENKYGPKDWVMPIAGVFAFLGIMLYNVDTPEERRAKDADQRAETCESGERAFYMSHEFVNRQLKAPSTAKYPSPRSDGVSTSYSGDCIHTVTAYVDAQNGFGAMIRQQYSAALQYNAASNNWILIDLQM